MKALLIILLTIIVLAFPQTCIAQNDDDISLYFEKLREIDSEMADDLEFILKKTSSILLEKNRSKYEKQGIVNIDEQKRMVFYEAISLIQRYAKVQISISQLLRENKIDNSRISVYTDSLLTLNGLERLPYLDSVISEQVKRVKLQHGLK
ncbi:MAG: hypothetical protein KF845_07060 [Cyclobacteriaceae bacterium]|nr:hypothetical protein [Cyclobacteriaceae bacterium]